MIVVLVQAYFPYLPQNLLASGHDLGRHVGRQLLNELAQALLGRAAYPLPLTAAAFVLFSLGQDASGLDQSNVGTVSADRGGVISLKASHVTQREGLLRLASLSARIAMLAR